MPSDRVKTVATWIISALLSLLFLFAGSGKLLAQEVVVKAFENFGFPSWFRVFIGACEVAGGMGLFISSLAQYAAAGLMIIMAGAVWAHISVGQPVALPVVVLVLLGAAIWLRRGR